MPAPYRAACGKVRRRHRQEPGGGRRGGSADRQTPLGRFGLPADIAPVAVSLASDDAACLTGERITASGGWR
jgi:NAD(P)-dependent dehydrogenase (short-subunit alcohol dehydrogenase family)